MSEAAILQGGNRNLYLLGTGECLVLQVRKLRYSMLVGAVLKAMFYDSLPKNFFDSVLQ